MKREKSMLNKIKDMKVEKKLKTCFTFTVIIASIAAVLGLIILLYTNITYNHALINSGFSQGEIGIFSTYLSKEPIIVRELILLEDEAEMKESEDELSDTKALTDKAYEDLKPHCQTKAELEYISEIDKLLPAYRALFDEVKVLAMNNQNEEAFDLLIQEAKPTYKELTDAVEALIDLNVSNGNTISRKADNSDISDDYRYDYHHYRFCRDCHANLQAGRKDICRSDCKHPESDRRARARESGRLC